MRFRYLIWTSATLVSLMAIVPVLSKPPRPISVKNGFGRSPVVESLPEAKGKVVEGIPDFTVRFVETLMDSSQASEQP